MQENVLSAEVSAAREASLHYVDDSVAGITRRRRGKAFSYVDAAGRAIREPGQLRRIKALAIPPAYENVWICPSINGHIQATGRDARGRKQYRYHPRWRKVRDEAKFAQTIAFARALPALRKRVAADLRGPKLARSTVLAAVVRLLDVTLARIGNEEYARENGSFGLTTLRSRHADVRKDTLRLHFPGKSGIRHEIEVHDPRLTAIVKRCQELPGQLLFTFEDEEGAPVPVSSEDVNAYLREAAGDEFTAKNFRTWHASVLCALELEKIPFTEGVRERKRGMLAAVRAVAEHLRNTAAVCRAAYIHPALVERYLDEGALILPARTRARTSRYGLDVEERRVLRFLERETRARS